MRGRFSLAMVIVALVSAAPSRAQQAPSLAEIARREAERRKAVTTPVKVYTNADVKKGGPPPTVPAVPVPAPTAGESTVAGVAEPASPVPAAPVPAEPVETRDEAWYRKRITELREHLARTRMAVEAFQSRANALWADFTARDDPAQRAVIEMTRQETFAELERLKREVAKLEQDILDFEEDARKAGVPPGWLR